MNYMQFYVTKGYAYVNLEYKVANTIEWMC